MSCRWSSSQAVGTRGSPPPVPVVVYAKELGASEGEDAAGGGAVRPHHHSSEVRDRPFVRLLRGHQRRLWSGGGDRLSVRGGYEEIAHTVVNALAVVSGVVCDGAKASCAAKIAAAVDAGILGYWMYRDGNQFFGGDGIVSKGVENTIRNVGRLACEGMKETDKGDH